MRAQDWILDGLRRVWPLLAPMLIVFAVTLLTSLGSASIQRAGALLLVQMVLVVALYMFSGISGVLSFGHMSFVAIAAYTSALLATDPALKAIILPSLPPFLASAYMPPVAALLIAALVAGAFGLVVGVPLVRLSGLGASMSTFAILIIVYTVASYWKVMTGGKVAIATQMTTDTPTALVWAVIVAVVAFIFQESGFGLRLQASREDEEAARAVGINIKRERLIAFVLSAFFTGIGGALYGHFLGGFSPDAFYITAVFMPIAMLVVGGVKSLNGAIVGTVVLWAVAEALRNVESGMSLGPWYVQGPAGMRELALGLIMLLILIYRPQGITGGREFPWPWKRGAQQAKDSVADEGRQMAKSMDHS